MNSRGAALAALTAVSALLAYVVFRKREPKAKKVEEVVQVEQEEVNEKVEPHEKVKSNEEPEKGLEVEEECLKTDEIRRGKESLMEWIDRQLEEAERKTGGSPWPEIPQEEGMMAAAGGEASHDDGALVDPDESFDSQKERIDLSDVKRDLKEAEGQLLGAVIQLEEAEKVVPSQEGKYEQSGEIITSADEKEGVQAAGTLLADDPKHSLDVVLEGSLKPESNNENSNAGEEEKSIDDSSLGDRSPSCTVDNDQFDMSSDSEIELLKDPSISGEDNEMGQLLDETESEGENTEDLTQHVVSLKNETSQITKVGSDTVEDTPDELIALRPSWQKNLPNKS